MREYILTQKERETLEMYIEKGVKLNGFSVLISRLKRANNRLDKDMKLIKTALEKVQ